MKCLIFVDLVDGFADQTDSALLPYANTDAQHAASMFRYARNISITHKLIKFSKLSNTVSGRNSISLSNKSL